MPSDPETKKTPAKADKATVAKRVDEVLRLIVAGASLYPDIVHYASENGWNVGERQLRNYLAQARQRIVAALDEDRPHLLNRHLAQRHDLYARSVSNGDLRTALAVLQDEAELLSLYPPKTTKVQFNEAALDRDIEQLLAQLAARGQGTSAGATGSHPGGGANGPVAPPAP